MMHLVVGWLAVAIAAFILIGTLLTRRGNREAMTALPIGLCVLIVGLWQLGVIPLGEYFSNITGIGKR